MRSALGLVATVAAIASFAGCGSIEAADNAVEATERSTVTFGGARYRVVGFRQLNVETAPAEALWDGDPPPPGHALYLAVIEVCNTGDRSMTSSSEIHLEDAFGQRHAPRTSATDPDIAYTPRRLEPGDCFPRPDSAAERTVDGAALVFQIPTRSIDRPLVLEIGSSSSAGTARVKLDL